MHGRCGLIVLRLQLFNSSTLLPCLDIERKNLIDGSSLSLARNGLLNGFTVLTESLQWNHCPSLSGCSFFGCCRMVTR